MNEIAPNVVAIMVHTLDRPGALHDLTEVIYRHGANIAHVDISERQGGQASTYFELEEVRDGDALNADLLALESVTSVEEMPSFWKIYGKRIIVVGGGAQVGQVALGAVSEADRHNIRGERISVDTIPLVGERDLAAAVRAVGPPAAGRRCWSWPARSWAGRSPRRSAR